MRGADGRFKKGHTLGFKKNQTGNAGGRPKLIVEVARAAKEWTREALETLAEVMRDKEATPSARVNAATALLDRGWGRPMQAVDVKISSDDVRNLTDAQLYDLIEQQRAQHRDAGEGANPASPGKKLN